MSKTIDDLNKSIEDKLDLENKQDKTDSSLKTTDKTIVGAINELFQDVDSGKTIIADAIDNSTITKNSTFDAMGTAITLLHNQITNLTNELANKVTPAGTAVAGDVISGKTFINSTGNIITGGMTNQGAKTFTPSASNQTGKAGYYSGITVNAVSNLSAGNIKSGVTVGGVTGTAPIPSGTATAAQVLSGYTFSNGSSTGISGTMVNRGGAQTVVPSTSSKTLNAGYYSGNITVSGDSDLIAANIKKGISLFGVAGTLIEFKTIQYQGVGIYTTIEYNGATYTGSVQYNTSGIYNYPVVAVCRCEVNVTSSYKLTNQVYTILFDATDADGTFKNGGADGYGSTTTSLDMSINRSVSRVCSYTLKVGGNGGSVYVKGVSLYMLQP